MEYWTVGGLIFLSSFLFFSCFSLLYAFNYLFDLAFPSFLPCFRPPLPYSRSILMRGYGSSYIFQFFRFFCIFCYCLPVHSTWFEYIYLTVLLVLRCGTCRSIVSHYVGLHWAFLGLAKNEVHAIVYTVAEDGACIIQTGKRPIVQF